jgi:Zn-dependent protease/CBS domain-containing protein
MTSSFRLGRIAGVEVGVNWSVLVIFGLIAWTLSAGQLPATHPGNPPWAYALAGVSAAVVFFLGLLAHELSHAVVAIRNGLSVDGVTLWMFGGVARLQGQARTPGAELRIAGVGPLVSLLLALAFGAVAMSLAVAGRTGLVFGAFSWLAGINVVLAVFNIVPAAPLDGGRILRAALWRWRGDRAWASLQAARAGRFLGLALIAVGLWQLLAMGATLAGLWSALIGWFLFGAARAEEQQARMVGVLDGLRVGHLMSPEPVTVPADVDVAEFVERYLPWMRHSVFPVLDDDRPVGLLAVGRVRAVAFEHRGLTRLRDIACGLDASTVTTADELVTDLLPRLRNCAEGRMMVLSGDRLVGIISRSDITQAIERAAVQHRTAPRRLR